MRFITKKVAYSSFLFGVALIAIAFTFGKILRERK